MMNLLNTKSIKRILFSGAFLAVPFTAYAAEDNAQSVADNQSIVELATVLVDQERIVDPDKRRALTKEEIGTRAIVLTNISKSDWEKAKAARAKARTKSCFGSVGGNVISCSVRETNDTSSIGASRPAYFSYTDNKGIKDGTVDEKKKDSVAIKVAIKTQINATDTFESLFNSEKTLYNEAYWTLKGQWHKTNLEDKEQDNLKLSAGLGLGFSNIGRILESNSKKKFWSVLPSTNIEYNRKAIFGNPKDDKCVADPTLRACGKQHLDTLRLTGNLEPYLDFFENNPVQEGFYYVFAPSFGVFYDDALNNDVMTLSDDPDDAPVNGSVTGGVASAIFAISPGVYKNKFELSAKAQIIEAWSRSDGRTSDFPKTSRLLSVSLDYALGNNYINNKQKNTWMPSIGITWSKGSDSLNGKESAESTVVGFKLKY